MKRLTNFASTFVAALLGIVAIAGSAVLPLEEPLRGYRLELKTYDLMAWIGQETGYSRYAIPKLHFVENIDRNVRTDWQPWKAAGYYDSKLRRIVLPKSWQGRTPRELSILVHELVHYMQHTNAPSGWLNELCPRKYEREASELEITYLNAHSGREWGLVEERLMRIPCDE